MSYSWLPQWRPTNAGWPSRFIASSVRGEDIWRPPRRSASHPGLATEADNVASWLVEHAARRPAEPALRDAERALSYAALDERCARAAALLRARGVARGERVALLLGNRSAMLELVFAA